MDRQMCAAKKVEMSFPKMRSIYRESTRETFALQWIPAFAGMTTGHLIRGIIICSAMPENEGVASIVIALYFILINLSLEWT
ncbi:MAG: hypothetical protein HGB11_12505 [Chlorobiales bacterium]|nr:hypothetical protein [Chlorobiales bacterium]